MRTFLVFLTVAWITGVATGGGLLAVPALVAVVGALVVVALRAGYALPIIAAIVIAGSGGYIASHQAGRSGACTEPPRTGVVIGAPRLEAARAKVRLRGENGCELVATVARFPVLQEGQRVAVSGGRWETVAEVAPQFSGYARYLTQQGVGAVWRYPDFQVLDDAPTLRSRLVTSAREVVQAHVREPAAGLVLAMVFNEQGMVAPGLVDQFRRTGTSHILAISGLNISLLAGMVWLLARFVPVRPAWRAVGVAALMWAYVFSIGAPVSAVRAAWFWTLLLGALNAHALVSLPTVLLLTVVAITANRPAVMQDVGWQLSVAAVAGIFGAFVLLRPYLGRLGRWRWLVGLVVTTLGAQVATAPVQLWHFGSLSLIAPLANVLVVPVVPLFLVVGLLVAGAGHVVPIVALWLGLVAHALAAWMEAVTAVFARLPGMYLEDWHITGATVATYYVAVAAGVSLCLRGQGRRWREIWE